VSSVRSPRRVEAQANRLSIWGLVATCLAGLGVVIFMTGLPLVSDYSRLQGFGIWPDVLHERATAAESLNGNPYRPISEITSEHGHQNVTGGLSPRTPAALLIQIPLTTIPEGILMPVVTLTICGCLLGILALTGRIAEMPWDKLVWAGPFLFLSHPAITSISYGSISVITTVALIVLAWAFQDKAWAGVPLGVAAAMRLWPGLVIVGFWISGRRRTAYIALAVFIGVNALALLLPGVTLEGSLHALTQGGVDWIDHNHNASLALALSGFGVPVAVTTVVASTIGVLLAMRNPSQAIRICLITALIASPLSWPAYMLAALPILASWWRAGGRIYVAILTAPLVLWIGTPTTWKGPLGLAVLTVLLIYCASAMARHERVERSETSLEGINRRFPSAIDVEGSRRNACP
jgi:hypothetical protein